MDPVLAFPTTRRGDLVIERSILRAPRGTIGLRQRMSGTAERIVVTHDAAFAAIVHVDAGVVTFPTASGEIRAPSRFILTVPARSIVRVCYRHAVVRSDGLGVMHRIHGEPTLRRAAAPERFELDALLESAPTDTIRLDEGAPSEIARARHLLHGRLGDLAPVRRVAHELGLVPDVLTRAFTRAYGLGPKRYCTRARLFDAAISMFLGASVASAAFEAQFGDVSRFYAQFRRLVGATPGAYAAVGQQEIVRTGRNRKDAR